jgi:hypothetical protein
LLFLTIDFPQFSLHFTLRRLRSFTDCRLSFGGNEIWKKVVVDSNVEAQKV